MSETISYVRKKTRKSYSIVFDSGEFKTKVVTRIFGYDSILGKWDKISETSELKPLDVHPTKPTKVIETFIVLMREATDFQSLKLLKAFYKQNIKVSVKDLESNIYLTMANGHVFMNDLVRGTCAPMQLNYTPQNIKFERLNEPERIGEQEKDALLKEGYLLFEELLMPNGKNELRLMV